MLLTPLGDTSPSHALIPPEAGIDRQGSTQWAEHLTAIAAEY